MSGRIDILGVPVDCLTRSEVLESIRGYLRGISQHHIATPNPEIVLEAQHNAPLLKILRSTSLNIADGVGLLWAARRHGKRIPERITGTDLLDDICSIYGLKIFLLGAQPGVAERAAAELRRRHLDLEVVGTFAGSPKPFDEDRIISMVNALKPAALFVAYGAPAQELWIARNLEKMPSVKVAMGVGGAFDFIAGVAKRAPRWMQKGGVEWLWRLARQPSRARRIFNATIMFPMRVLTKRR